jgi:hypothetical protein
MGALGLVALLSQGCVALGLTLFGAAAGTAAGTGTSHALDAITYKTFTVPLEGVEKATLLTLERMAFSLDDVEDIDSGRRLHATSPTREVEVELERLTPKTTRMRVVAKQNWFLRDRATATEIILQTDQTLTDNPKLAATAPAPRPAAARPPAK